MLFSPKTKQILGGLFLLCLAFTAKISAQSPDIKRWMNQARFDFDNGNFSRSVEFAEIAIEKAKKTNSRQLITDGLEILVNAQISLQKYDEAEKNLNAALQNVSNDKSNIFRKANLYLKFSFLRRSQRKFAESFNYSKQAVALVPDDRQILAGHYLNFGRILYASGFDLSAIIWLEKAERLLDSEKTTSAKLDTYRFLALAWWAKLDYQKAVYYFQKWKAAAEKTQFKQNYRQALFDLSTILGESGQQTAAIQLLQQGLKLTLENDDLYQEGKFLTYLLLSSLDNEEVAKASAYLKQLEKVDQNGSYSFEILLGQSVIAAYKNETENSLRLFSQLEKMESPSEFILPGWKVKIAKRDEDWKKLIQFNQKLLDLTIENNFRDELPAIHLDFARAYFNLNQLQLSQEHLEKSLGYIEEIRQSENTNLSLGLSETYHDAYRLLTEIKADQPQESFDLADFLKARLLKDKINNTPYNSVLLISKKVREQLEELTLKYDENQSTAAEIEKIEKSISAKTTELNLIRPDLSQLNNIPKLNDTVIVSYFFTLDKKLLAFVWEKGKPVRSVPLNVSEGEIEEVANATLQNIKNRIFFKRDGKVLYDKLLKPLNLSEKHLIIVPDKSLWKIPFQALSSDGEKYLIEEKIISYAPSVSVLLDQLKKPKPDRRTLQSYANSVFEDKVLQFADKEATSVAAIYGSKPILNATVSNFTQNSDEWDIIHLSMHAQIDREQPLDSFLGFKKIGKDDGRLTTEELLNTKLKKGSLAFLASCDTNMVLSGEGLVSLAWGMMASGATTVVSAQWEANDKSTEIFTKAFYVHYKQRNSAAEALQKAALELIRNKSNNMHEPYYWADFTLIGDFR